MPVNRSISQLTVICICTIDPTNWSRPVYSKMWVDRLYRAVKRNLHIPFDFVCMSNDLDQNECDYHIHKLETNSWGWWYKFEMFKPGQFSGPCLYIDLDNLICKDITDTVKNLPQDLFLMPVEPYKDILNGSMIFWNGDYSDLYLEYVDRQEQIVDQYRYATEQQPATGDQGFFKDRLHNLQAFDNYAPKNFFGWKHHIAGTHINDPSVLIFTGSEKPTNNPDLDLVKLHWKD